MSRSNGDGAPPPARARESADEQIDHILKLMLEGEWKGAESHRVLAAGWGCHPRTVGDRAVAAAAVLRRIGGPVEDLVKAKLAELEHIKETAMGLQRPVVVDKQVELYPAPDVKTAAMAVKTYLEVLGAFNHTRKVQVDGIKPGEDARTVREKLVAALAEVDKQLAAEQKEMH